MMSPPDRPVSASRGTSGWLLRAAMALCLAVTASTAGATEWGSMQLLGRDIAVGQSERFPAVPDRTFEASYLNMPVFVARGATAGPTLCVTAGVHGDELNGVEVARRAFAKIDPQSLRGTNRNETPVTGLCVWG